MVYVLLDALYWFTPCVHRNVVFSIPFCFLRSVAISNSLVRQASQLSVFKLFSTDEPVSDSLVFSYKNVTPEIFGREVFTHRTLKEPCIVLLPDTTGSYYPLNYSDFERDFIRDVLNTASVPFRGDQEYANNLFTLLKDKLYLLIYYLYRALEESTEEAYKSFYLSCIRNAVELFVPGNTLNHILTYLILSCKVYPYVSQNMSTLLTN